jgi:hypothetical protein
MRMKRTVHKVARQPEAVERRSKLSEEEFFDRYYAANIPVVVTDALEPWPPTRRWTPSAWKEQFGDTIVEVSRDREADPFFEPNYKAHCSTMRLGDFCDQILTTESTNDFYLVANNGLTQRPGLEPLLDDMRPTHAYLDDRRDSRCISIWLGPRGTVTPLHHDTANVLFCQVFGRKRILLFPSCELFLTHDTHHAVHSAMDPEHPDLDSYPQFADVRRMAVELSPGEGLFIPVGWWHHVRALDVSISVSFTNFRRPNHFDWYFPGNVA